FEYAEYGGAAHTKLLWSSPTQTKEVVPTTALYAADPETDSAVVTEVMIPAASGDYTLSAPPNTQIWINGVLLIDGWNGERQKTIYLQEGESYQIEYRRFYPNNLGGGSGSGSFGWGDADFYDPGDYLWGGLALYSNIISESSSPEPEEETDPCSQEDTYDEGSGEMPPSGNTTPENTSIAFPAATRLFGGENPGEGFQIPFTAPHCGSLDLTVEVDGPLSDYMQALTDSLSLTSGSYRASNGETLSLAGRLKTFDEMSFEEGRSFEELDKDRLYGSKVKLKGVYSYSDGSTETREQDIYLYRWLEVVAANDTLLSTGKTAAFHEKEDEDSVGNITVKKEVKTKQIKLHLPTSVSTTFEGTNPDINYGGSFQGEGTAEWLVASAGVIPSPDGTDIVKVNIRDGVHPEAQIGDLVVQGNWLTDLKQRLKDLREPQLIANPARTSGLHPWQTRANEFHEEQRQWAFNILKDNAQTIFETARKRNITPDAIAGAILWEALENPYNNRIKGNNFLFNRLQRRTWRLFDFGIPGKVNPGKDTTSDRVHDLVEGENQLTFNGPFAIRVSNSGEPDEFVTFYAEDLNRQEIREVSMLTNPAIAIEFIGAIMDYEAKEYIRLADNARQSAVDDSTRNINLIDLKPLTIRDQAGILANLYQGGINADKSRFITQEFLAEPNRTPGLPPSESEAMPAWVSHYRWWIRRLLQGYGVQPYNYSRYHPRTAGNVDKVEYSPEYGVRSIQFTPLEIPEQYQDLEYDIWK
ncbi:MAG: hypothetical protein SAJ12_18840, partial [Jaaginema sp. PMC 1079.18]|nr:hypothetical protein [Jaaginema sp. PMC 1079.18]